MLLKYFAFILSCPDLRLLERNACFPGPHFLSVSNSTALPPSLTHHLPHRSLAKYRNTTVEFVKSSDQIGGPIVSFLTMFKEQFVTICKYHSVGMSCVVLIHIVSVDFMVGHRLQG